MINLFEQSRRYLNIAIILLAALLVFLVLLAVLFWRIPWLVPSWQQAPSPQQIGMLRWEQQGFPVSVLARTGVAYSDAAFDGNKLWVTYTEKGEGFVVPYDPLTGNSGAPSKVGNDPVGVLFDGQHIWVANRGSQSLSCFEPYGNAMAPTETADTAPEPTAAAGTTVAPTAIAADITVRTWDLKAGEAVSAQSPTNLAFDGEHIWVTDPEGGAVWRLPAASCDRPTTGGPWDTRIDKVNGKPFKTPSGIIFDGKYVWVANQGSNEVMRLNPDNCDATNCEEARSIKVGGDNSHPSNLAYDGTFVWVTLKGTDSGQVARVHAQAGLVFGKPFLGQPITISTAHGAGAMPTATPRCSPVQEQLDGIAFDGRYLWIASNTGWVYQLRALDATPVAEFRASGTEDFGCTNANAAARIAFDGTFVWTIITNGEYSSFTRR